MLKATLVAELAVPRETIILQAYLPLAGLAQGSVPRPLSRFQWTRLQGVVDTLALRTPVFTAHRLPREA